MRTMYISVGAWFGYQVWEHGLAIRCVSDKFIKCHSRSGSSVGVGSLHFLPTSVLEILCF